MNEVVLPQLGGCLCGYVGYKLNGAPLLAYVCHCHACQTQSGAAFTLTLVIHTTDLAVTGSPEIFKRVTKAGRKIDQSLCPQCRIALFASAPVAPEYTSLRAGTLSDASWVVPIAQSFVESAIPWAVIPGVKVVPWDVFDYAALGEEWRAEAPVFTFS